MNKRIGLLAAALAVFCFNAGSETWPRAAVAWAAPGGGGGDTPPPQPLAPNVLTLPVNGKLAQPDSTVTLRLQLFEGPLACPSCAVAVLYEETQVVSVRGGRFNLALGKRTAAGIPPEVVVEKRWLMVRWALSSAPTVFLGSVALTAAPAAMTLAPGAVSIGSTANPTLTVTNTTGHALLLQKHFGANQQNAASDQSAIHAESPGTTGSAIYAKNSGTVGKSPGVSSFYGAGKGLKVVNNGGGTLIEAYNTTTGKRAFEVMADGRMFSNLAEIGLPGERGEDGAAGQNGKNGKSIKNVESYCFLQNGSQCECGSGETLLSQSEFACTSSQGPCEGLQDLCCVCAP